MVTDRSILKIDSDTSDVDRAIPIRSVTTPSRSPEIVITAKLIPAIPEIALRCRLTKKGITRKTTDSELGCLCVSFE